MVTEAYQILYLWCLFPVVFSYYETEVGESVCRRIGQAVRLQLPLILFLLIATVPTYFLFNEVIISEEDCEFT